MRRLQSDKDIIFVPVDAAMPRGRFVLMVPGQMVPIHTLRLPQGVTGQARQRIAKQDLSDRTGEPAESFEVIFLDTEDPASTRVLACDRAALADWCACDLARARNCAAVLPDYLALPGAAGHVSVRQDGETLRVRIGTKDGFTAPAGLSDALLRRGLDGQEMTSFSVEGDVAPQILKVLRDAGLKQAEPLIIAARKSDLAVDLRRASGSRAEISTGTARLWTGAAVLGLVAFALWAASLWYETRMLNSQTAQVNGEITALLRERLIPNGPILDIRQQVTRALEGAAPTDGMQNDQGALALLSDTSLALFGQGVTVRSVTLASEQDLSVDIAAADFSQIDALIEAMKNQGLTASAGNLRAQTGGGVLALISVARAPGRSP